MTDEANLQTHTEHISAITHGQRQKDWLDSAVPGTVPHSTNFLRIASPDLSGPRHLGHRLSLPSPDHFQALLLSDASSLGAHSSSYCFSLSHTNLHLGFTLRFPIYVRVRLRLRVRVRTTTTTVRDFFDYEQTTVLP